jgi:hypothetical protein
MFRIKGVLFLLLGLVLFGCSSVETMRSIAELRIDFTKEKIPVMFNTLSGTTQLKQVELASGVYKKSKTKSFENYSGTSYTEYSVKGGVNYPINYQFASLKKTSPYIYLSNIRYNQEVKTSILLFGPLNKTSDKKTLSTVILYKE